MIFGVLNPEKIWHQYLVHFPTSPVYCSHFTLGNPKSHFQQYYWYTLQIIFVISEEDKLLLPYPPHLKNVTTLPCKMHKFFIFFIFSGASSTNPRYGVVAEAFCCDMGWISAEHGGRCNWSVAKKTGSLYPCRRWSLWTFAITLRACHISQLVLFRATNANSQLAFSSEPPTFGRMQHTFSQTKKLCILQGSAVTFFRYGG